MAKSQRPKKNLWNVQYMCAYSSVYSSQLLASERRQLSVIFLVVRDMQTSVSYLTNIHIKLDSVMACDLEKADPAA